jgi:hypothetical protein
MGNRRGVYRILVKKSEGKRSPGRPTCRWKGKNKMDINPYPANVEKMVSS